MKLFLKAAGALPVLLCLATGAFSFEARLPEEVAPMLHRRMIPTVAITGLASPCRRDYIASAGVWIVETDRETVKAVVSVNGEERVAATATSREKLLGLLETRQNELKEAIELQYGVRIAADGSRTGYGGDLLRARAPKLNELLAVEFALQRSCPAYLAGSKKKALSVYFLTDSRCLGALATWGLERNGRTAMYIEPMESSSTCTLESTLIHELAHNSQFLLGMNPEDAGKWKIARELGWNTYNNPSTGESGWLLHTRDGVAFKYCQSMNRWIRCNATGQPLDSSGNRVKRRLEAETLSNGQMAERALVKPATNYFTNPAELLAEAMMLFRLGKSTRSYLRDASPELYSIVKQLDQKEIDSAFGSGNRIRTADGLLAEADPQAAAALSEFENAARERSTTPPALALQR